MKPALLRGALLRLAWRDLRGGLKGYGVFIACIALGVAAIVGVAATSSALREGLAREGRILLGADVSFGRAQRPLQPDERAFLVLRGALSEIITLRSMARFGEATALVEIKAVDGAYPLTGAVDLTPAQPLDKALAREGERFGVVVDPALSARLGARVGDAVNIGRGHFEIRALLAKEPDNIGAGLGFGPRVMMSAQGLQTTSLLEPGALTRSSARLTLAAGASDEALDRLVRDANAAFPQAGWEVRTRAAVSPQLSRNLERFSQLLTLIGLTALACGGVGLANAARGLIERKRRALAIFKALGATDFEAFQIVFLQVALIALASALLGAAIGLGLPYLLAASAGRALALPIVPHLSPLDAGVGVIDGLLAAALFALPALGRAHDIRAVALLRDNGAQAPAPVRRPYLLASIAALVALIALTVFLAQDHGFALGFALAVALAFLLLHFAGQAVMALARRAPRPKQAILRLALVNLYRPGALTPALVLSLGLGASLLTTLSLTEYNLRKEIADGLGPGTPSFFFLDVPNAKAQAFAAFLKEQASDGRVAAAPLLRGRIVRIKGVAAEQAPASRSAAWVLEGDRGVTFADAPPPGSRVVAGAWWKSGYQGRPLVSLDAGVAEGLGLKIGDELSVNVLGRNLDAKVANLRAVNWRSLGINFVLVFSPNAFAGAPYMQLMTLSLPAAADPDREGRIVRAAAEAFPAVTSIGVRQALQTLDDALSKLSSAILAASAAAFAVCALVMAAPSRRASAVGYTTRWS